MKKTGSFDERNHLLYKWLPLLLGLMIIKTAVNIALSYLLIKSPDLFVILSGATALIIGGFHTYILYKIKSASKGFALASLLIPISIVLAVAASLFTIFNVNAAVFIIFAAIANVVSVSEEYDAHSAVVLGIEDNNSRKWIQLWKVYSAVILLYLISLLAAYYNELNMFILIICIAVMAIESILEIVFLYSNLVVFKDICKRRK
ncbi:MAG: hypothetical protein HFE63_04795 [Clostridiales bacterium]|nr:hypothetical protein [Clostridiales bacterium]